LLTPHNKAVAGKCELEPMNKELTTLVNRNEVQASATASYAKRYKLVKQKQYDKKI